MEHKSSMNGVGVGVCCQTMEINPWVVVVGRSRVQQRARTSCTFDRWRATAHGLTEFPTFQTGLPLVSFR